MATNLINITQKTKKIHGFVQQFEHFPHIRINLTIEFQFKTLHKIKREHRILHVDATGKLVVIPKRIKEYPQIMNYAFLVKDASLMNISNKRGLLLSETITSKQDTEQLLSMFIKIKFHYRSLYENDQSPIFKMIMSDLSWPTIRAAL